MPLSVEVLFAGSLSARTTDELVQDFQAVGLTARLREVAPRRSLSDIAWLILAAVPLKPFFDALAKDAADDAYRRLKTLTSRVSSRGTPVPPTPPQVLLLQDSSTGVRIVLEPDLPDEAFERLLRFDLTTIRHGPLHYDRHRGEWRSELDEADRGASPSSG